MNETNDTPTPPVSWESLGLKEDLLKLIHQAGFANPTPVQAMAIPHALNNEDVIVSAQTGTGKTAAFVFPIIERVKGRNGTYALVLAPTREIATQTQTVLKQFGEPLGIRSVALIGGTNVRQDEIELRNYPQVVVATPGRLCDHLDRGNIWLEYLEMLVLDEADRMLDMGFSEQLNRILSETSTNRQTLLYSATLSPRVETLAKKILYEPFRIKIGHESRAAHTVEQKFIFVDEDRKLRELERLIYEEKGTMFIFARSKDSAARLWRSLRNRGFHDATQLHSDLEQNVREKALQDFKDGRYRVLIATDVVGRGIHVDDVAHVINFDLPRDAEDYIHRIGRTGRAESSGKATSLVTPRDTLALRKIEKMLGKSVSPGRSENSSAGEGGNAGEANHERKNSTGETRGQNSGNRNRSNAGGGNAGRNAGRSSARGGSGGSSNSSGSSSGSSNGGGGGKASGGAISRGNSRGGSGNSSNASESSSGAVQAHAPNSGRNAGYAAGESERGIFPVDDIVETPHDRAAKVPRPQPAPRPGAGSFVSSPKKSPGPETSGSGENQ